MVPGEVLRQQHTEHDANRRHVLSHTGKGDRLLESKYDNDQCKQQLWFSANSVAKYFMVPLPNRDDAVCLRHAKATYAGSTIRINLGPDVSEDDVSGVQVCQSRNTWRRIRSSRATGLLGHKVMYSRQLVAGSAGVRGKQVRVAQTARAMFGCSSLRQVVLIRCCLLKLRLTDNLQCISLAAVRRKRGM